MSVILAVTAAGLYAALVVGVHRWNIGRLRARASLLPLTRLDWDALLEGLLPSSRGPYLSGVPESLPTGEATPELLRHEAKDAEPRRRLLAELVAGTPAGLEDLETRAQAAGFSGGEAAWLRTLATLKVDPLKTIERLEATRPTSAAELYLREYLRLTRETHSGNLELNVFVVKRRVALGLSRFGDAPCLYFVRAFANAQVGLNRAAIDDLARAVYFSHQHPFYVRAVLDSPYIEKTRPALAYQCRHALESQQ